MADPSSNFAAPYTYQYTQSAGCIPTTTSLNQLAPIYTPSPSGAFRASSQSSGSSPDGGRGQGWTSLSGTGYDTPICSSGPCGNAGCYSAPAAPHFAGELHPLIPSKFKYAFPRNKILKHRSYEVLAIEEGPKDVRNSSYGRSVYGADEVLGRVKRPYRKKTIFGIARRTDANHTHKQEFAGIVGRGSGLPSGQVSRLPSDPNRAWSATKKMDRATLSENAKTSQDAKKSKGWMRNWQCFLCTSADYVSTEQAALEEQNEHLDEALTEFQETNRIQAIRLFETENQLEKKNEALEQLQLQLEYETAELKKKNMALEKGSKIAEDSLNELREKVVKTIETVCTIRESADTSELDAVLRDFCFEVANVLNAARESGVPGPTIIIPAASPLNQLGSPSAAGPVRRKVVKKGGKAKKGLKKKGKGGKKKAVGKKKKGAKAGGARKGKAKGSGVKGTKGKKAKGASGAIKKKAKSGRKPAKTVARRAKVVKKKGNSESISSGVSVPVMLGYDVAVPQSSSPYLLQQISQMQHQSGERPSLPSSTHSSRASAPQQLGVAGIGTASSLQFLLYPGFLESQSKNLGTASELHQSPSTAKGSLQSEPQHLPSDPISLANLMIDKQLAARVLDSPATTVYQCEVSSVHSESHPEKAPPEALDAPNTRLISV
ncbi:conserved hypothetical protein [Neospora caninum Liverpool]|uniref:Uncharacterized protein n=1 Tax=Neospora caninum (strain Liverpool) TaxID=572307 RepID=F0VMG1_NEOCL|nr:conserved hypothetical protein [Neospora caninum Liverpool]CBZ54907.1 conserved hypothetical protein [Neospora caninum Liverpool]CEL69628.1 TPA: hypothetical protein BN1204_053330 [Neospora caninum Liverpool]|eukprot:XP_003884935.1 conserved hypothetical protein [Neospora caninum Liverpool]